MEFEGLLDLVPTVKTGLRDVMGSWKIIEIRFPRIFRISSSWRLRRFCPLKRISPLTDLAGGSG